MQFKELTMSFGVQTVFENINLNLPESVNDLKNIFRNVSKELR